MMPATKIDPISRSASTRGPTKAPKAPASFQSPAPRARNSTKGSNNSKPKPAPSRESFIPVHLPANVFNTTPATNPGTVSQFGMRRLRKSVQPAIKDRSTAQPRIAVFKPASADAAGSGMPVQSYSYAVEKEPFYAS